MDKTKDSAARRLLIDMLQEAAKLEHCLLNSYLFAACSLKSTPQEFENCGDALNRRRAIHFERVRGWKQIILGVAHEEMRHLHYVQCMIRALGERPCFDLPARNSEGVWVIPNWRVRVGEHPVSDKGMAVPVGGVDEDAVRRFVLFESTDSLQEQDPFGAESTALFKDLYDFELELRLESMLVNMTPGPARDAIKTKLKAIYTQLTPVERKIVPEALMAAVAKLPSVEQIQFQSIGDFYRIGIVPLYQQAFDEGWVVFNDRDLVDEQLNPDYAAEGFLPVGPFGRTERFARFAQQNVSDPLANYKRLEDIVEEIVEEGEGVRLFLQRAKDLLSKIAEIGPLGFVRALAADRQSGSTPDWLYEAQIIRKSHLYAFAMILQELREEEALAKAAGVVFQPSRTPVSVSALRLSKVVEQLPAHFNACYLAMLAWLARMYEPRHWAADSPRRMAIEMVATWPLMSLAIRPFLELASFFPIDPSRLFRIDSDALPMLPIWAQELAELYHSPERSEAINERMDVLVMRTLKGAANWASEQIWAVAASGLPAHEREMITTRLKALAKLDEFERQFPYRVAGGYSNRAPNLTYQNLHPDSGRFEENPTTVNPLFSESLVMRLRFRGWGLVQLATDPDPPTDESGCTGTIMLHAADGDRELDRALVWQDFEPDHNIRRPVAEAGPPLGVNCVEAAVLVPALGTGTQAGYSPLQILSSTGAVQTSGVQQVLKVNGLNMVATVSANNVMKDGSALRMYLESKNDVRPFLNGDNHLIWQDGEPVDPFIVSLYADSGKDGEKPIRLFSREAFNENRTINEMEPYQRLLTCRGPVGFDSIRNLPAWALTPETQSALAPGFPQSFLAKRCRVLADQLENVLGSTEPLDKKGDQQTIDQIVSVAERLLLTAQPRGTTVNWLRFLLHYGHTVSGAMDASAENPVLDALSTVLGLKLQVTAVGSNRNGANSRWLIDYTKGMMDVDAISDFVYGELYVPLTATGKTATFKRAWSFPAAMKDVVRAFGVDFTRPFWLPYKVDEARRTVEFRGLDPDNPDDVSTLTETLIAQSPNGYRYNQTGFPHLSSYEAAFALGDADNSALLTWSCEFGSADPHTLVRCYALLAGTAGQIEGALGAHFKINTRG
jgi:hypothetical protein